MTAKDYRAIAQAFKDSWPSDSIYPEARAGRVQWATDVRCIAKALSIDNVRFDQARFEEACGHYEYMHGKQKDDV